MNEKKKNIRILLSGVGVILLTVLITLITMNMIWINNLSLYHIFVVIGILIMAYAFGRMKALG